MKPSRKIKPETTFAEEVLHGLDDFFAAVDRGETITVRTVKLELEPRRYDADAIRAIRARLGASQAIFAQLLAVSVDLVQKWERGDREPQPVHRRLLEDIDFDPKAWLRRLASATRTRYSGRSRRAG